MTTDSYLQILTLIDALQSRIALQGRETEESFSSLIREPQLYILPEKPHKHISNEKAEAFFGSLNRNPKSEIELVPESDHLSLMMPQH